MIMSDTLRVGVLGLTHDHIWGEAEAVANCEETQLVAAADPNGPLTARFKDQFDCPTYASAEAMLENESMEAVYVFGSNREGAELAIDALGRGLHVVVEKPMAADLDGANRMVAAAKESGARLIVNWPFSWWPQLQKALDLALSGELGDVIGVNYRSAHAGPAELGCSEYFCDWLYDAQRNGAGAMMDYCCYGSVLAAALMGIPEYVVGMTGGQVKGHLSVEDSGIISMRYARGMSTATASWTQIGNLTSYYTAIYGTKGTLWVEPYGDGKLYWATEDKPNGELVDVPEAPAWLANSATHLAEVVKRDREPWLLCRDGFSREAQEILEAGIRSAKTGEQVALPLK